MRLRENLSYLRKQRGMTQMELAEKLDISRQAVSRWEQGVSEPSTENLVNIGKLFDVSVDALMNEDIQLHAESAVPVTVKDIESDESTVLLRGSSSAEFIKQVVVACFVSIISALIVSFCCFGMWVSSHETKEPVSVDELDQTKLDDEFSDNFDMEKLGE